LSIDLKINISVILDRHNDLKEAYFQVKQGLPKKLREERRGYVSKEVWS